MLRHRAAIFLTGRDAAAVTDVGLDEVRAAALQEVAHLCEGIEPLARRDGNRGALVHLRESVKAVGRRRLLEEIRVKGLECVCNLYAGSNIEAAMAFNQQVNVISDRAAHSLNDLYRAAEVEFSIYI